MLPACRTDGEGFSIPTFDVVPSDVEGFMEELWEFQSTFHDCFARSEPRAHFFDYMVGQFSKLERKSIEPMALQVELPVTHNFRFRASWGMLRTPFLSYISKSNR